LGEPAHAAERAMTDAWTVCDALAKQILALQPTTLAGFAVQARVVKYSHPLYWEKETAQLEYPDYHIRQFVDAVLAVH
jgi:hypothetical protein